MASETSRMDLNLFNLFNYSQHAPITWRSVGPTKIRTMTAGCVPHVVTNRAAPWTQCMQVRSLRTQPLASPCALAPLMI
eukprot:12351368-Alexandrium_andersonii.AAC.1